MVLKLDSKHLKGRSFVLGNRKAFTLLLPAANGANKKTKHLHKWFGAYFFGTKFLEGQVVEIKGKQNRFLNQDVQSEFQHSLTDATRIYEIEGQVVTERFFVPNGLNAFASIIKGDCEFSVQPQFDIRFGLALGKNGGYECKQIIDGAVVSKALPNGEFDDLSETYHENVEGRACNLAFAAVQLVAEGARTKTLYPTQRTKTVHYKRDRQRSAFLTKYSPHAVEHAPLWRLCENQVYVPISLSFKGHGTILYGFGNSEKEALTNLGRLRDCLSEHEAAKQAQAASTLDHNQFMTGNRDVDLAWNLALTRLIDALVVDRAVLPGPYFDSASTMILAGTEYFQDSWKRDENIALDILLELGLFDLARELVNSTWKMQDDRTGRLPQRIRVGEAPAYHSSDGTLWALWRLHQYELLSGDGSICAEKMEMVAKFFRLSLQLTVRGMLPSGKTKDPDYLWETWMDTEFTPRNGFPVEIQFLWIACLKAFSPRILQVDSRLAATMQQALADATQSLNMFKKNGTFVDSLDESCTARDMSTPNQFFAFGLGIELGEELESNMRALGRNKLRGEQGIITLNPDDWGKVYPDLVQNEHFVKNGRQRSCGKFNYHRGLEWNWLNQFFAEAELKVGNGEAAYELYLRRLVESTIQEGGIGGISELHDLDGGRGPAFQTWSMAGLLVSLQRFAGVKIDVPQKSISITPQLPDSWPTLHVRKWFGNIPFTVSLSRSDSTCSVTGSHQLRQEGVEFKFDLSKLGRNWKIDLV